MTKREDRRRELAGEEEERKDDDGGGLESKRNPRRGNNTRTRRERLDAWNELSGIVVGYWDGLRVRGSGIGAWSIRREKKTHWCLVAWMTEGRCRGPREREGCRDTKMTREAGCGWCWYKQEKGVVDVLEVGERSDEARARIASGYGNLRWPRETSKELFLTST